MNATNHYRILKQPSGGSEKELFHRLGFSASKLFGLNPRFSLRKPAEKAYGL